MLRRMTGLPLLLFLTALWILPVITASAVDFDEDTSPVDLIIDKWCQVEILDDLDITVTSAEIPGSSVLTKDNAYVDILANFNATLKCSDSVTLTRVGGTETHDVFSDIEHFVTGLDPPVHIGNFWYIDYKPGDYLSQTRVNVTIVRDWLLTDMAGDYTGTLIPELSET